MKAHLGSLNLSSARFSHVHIDLVGRLPVSSGFRYCLTAIDSFTRWPEAFPLSDITAEAVAKAFVSVWVALSVSPANHNRRRQAIRGPSLQDSGYLTGSSLTRTTAWHPASDGLIERLRRQL